MSPPVASPRHGPDRPDRPDRPDSREIAVAILWTTVRVVLGFIVIFALLLLLPSASDGSFWLPLTLAVLAIVFYLWFFRRQLRRVYRAKFPTLQAVEALVLVAAMFLAIFAMVYVMISLDDPAAFSEQLSAFTSYYFALTVLATVGFGDITPVTTLARSITMVQMALDLAFLAVLLKLMGGAAKLALKQRHEQPDMPTTSTVLDE